MATMYGVCDASVAAEGLDAIIETICDEGTIFTCLEAAQEFTEDYMKDYDVANCLILEFELNPIKTKVMIKQHAATFKTVNISELFN